MLKHNIKEIRDDFPILNTLVNNKPLIYFDNAASAQKPVAVINSMNDYYKHCHANIHRALHYLGDLATSMYEEARAKVANYLNAESSVGVVFTRGTTESINLISTCLGRSGYVNKDDEIVLSVAEHHSNIVPWQILAEQTGAVIKVVNLLQNQELNLDHLYSLISEKTKVLTLAHVYNGTGIINPVKDIIKKVKMLNPNVIISIDGAQAMANFKVDVSELDCDFYSFSGHKMYGPTGIGGLYAKADILRNLKPYHGGGEMIDQVKLPTGTTYADIPHKFEAGTPDIAGAIGLGAAVDYLNSLDFNKLLAHKNELLTYCTRQLKELFADSGLVIYGDTTNKAAVIAFSMKKLNSQDIGLLLDQYGIAVRTGHHCNMPLMDSLGISGTIRISFGIYNTIDEVKIFLEVLADVIKRLS